MENTTRVSQLAKYYDDLIKANSHIKPIKTQSESIIWSLNKEIEIVKEALDSWTDASKKTYKEKYKRVFKKLVSLENELEEFKKNL